VATYWREGTEYAGCPPITLTPEQETATLERAGLPHPSTLDTEDPRWLEAIDALAAERLARWERTDAGRPSTSALF
jgi:hypothetical protein